MSNTPVVQFDTVSVHLGQQMVLNSVTWTVQHGEHWVIAGPNAAGKSTLLQIAAAVRFPTTGHVTVLGAPFGRTDLRALRQRIGFVGTSLTRQLPGSHTATDVVLTGRDSVAQHWKQSDTPTERAQAHSLLERVGCGHSAAHRFGELSDGQRARVLVARALMGRPELLLLDEPAAGMDLAGREQFVDVLADLAASAGPVCVLVTHHVEEVPPGFTHALVVREGRVVAAGPIKTTLTGPVLTQAFDLPIAVRWDEGRITARRASFVAPA